MNGNWPSPESEEILVLGSVLNNWDRKQLEELVSFLDSTERQQLQRFHFASNRYEYLLAHALARWMLANCVGEKHPAQLPISREPYGKPYLSIPNAPAFSLSHCAGAVACAVTYGGRVGLDIEDTSRQIPFNELGGLVYSAKELAILRERAEIGSPYPKAIRWWTLKEAYAKADGRGLGIDLARLCCADEGRGAFNIGEDTPPSGGKLWHQGICAHGMRDFCISWFVLDHNKAKTASYGEWLAGEIVAPMEIDMTWRCLSDGLALKEKTQIHWASPYC